MVEPAKMVLNQIQEFLYKLFDANSDPRMKGWILSANPLPTLFLCFSYVYFVKVLGPRLMKNREPFNVRGLMIFYNFAMVIFNIILFTAIGTYGWFGKYSFKCQPVDYSTSPDALGMLTAGWWYYFSKIVDFTDTIFLVLRKKNNHVTTLHVVHHGIMPMSVWFGLKFAPGGHSSFFGFVNCFVHIVMYGYYALAAIGPHMQKYLWWKKYMTILQMVQFVMIFVHSFQLLFRECDYPRIFVWWIGMHAVLFWFLFSDFYKNTYLKQKASKGIQRKKAELDKEPIENNHSSKNYHNHSNGLKNGYVKQHKHENNNLDISSYEKDAPNVSYQRDIAESSGEKKAQ